MNDLVKKSFASTALTSLDDDAVSLLISGIEDSQSQTVVAGDGVDLIKLDKSDGSWSMGQASDAVQDGAQFWINVLSLCHGHVCWSNYEGKRKNERLGEIMAPMSAPKPPKPNPIDGFPFKEQRSFEAICLIGEDAGRKVKFSNGSVGTLKAFKKLEDAVKAQLRKNRNYPCPVVEFESEKYRHGDYGWIQNPIFKIVDWADLQGNRLSGGEPEATPVQPAPKPAPAAAAKPSLKKPSLKVVEEVAGEAEAEPVAEAPRGPRRRPPAA
jgi:hypothetical protein